MLYDCWPGPVNRHIHQTSFRMLRYEPTLDMTMVHRNFEPLVVSKTSPSTRVYPPSVIVPALAPLVIHRKREPCCEGGARVQPATLFVISCCEPSPGSGVKVEAFVGSVGDWTGVRKPPEKVWSAAVRDGTTVGSIA